MYVGRDINGHLKVFRNESYRQAYQRSKTYKNYAKKLQQIKICKEQIKEAYEMLCKEEKSIMRKIKDMDEYVIEPGLRVERV